MSGKYKLSDGNNLQIAEKMLRDVTRICDLVSAPYWLEGGTQIGLVREQRLLPWDNDMDISMYDTHKSKLWLIIPMLLLQGYRLTLQNHQTDMGPFKRGELKIIKIRNYTRGLKKGKVTLDVFIKRKIGAECFWVVGVKKRVLKSTPSHFTESLSTIRFKDKDYLIPSDYDGYLTYRYGAWREPQKEWDFRVDDQAIVGKDY
ncbi:MAG: LicD family protein [Candidatus Marinimicrobia bacterium]|nr:LicD family protein [FCB group bacterium]MBL7024021.1 LicD family protein [Candidatus Neomarinimicrobiota bacterium]